MGTPRGGLRSWLARIDDDDRGTTLAELLVGMAVMTVFMTIFTGAVVSMAKTTSTVEAVTSSSAQVNSSFLRLDKLVRYASAITTPGRTGAGWYVEIDSMSAAKETCTQLRVAGDVLQQRTWTARDSTHFEDLTGWTALASNITNGSAVAESADQPFVLPTGSGNVSTRFQQLEIRLTATTSGAAATSVTRGEWLFTALNSSSSDAQNDTKCQQLPAGVLRP